MYISSILQEAANKVYNISCRQELARFTSHFIRVGACVFLYSHNVSA